MDCGLCSLAVAALVVLVVLVVLICISDADLTLMFHERFGAARLGKCAHVAYKPQCTEQMPLQPT
jgi:hypothetical protein